jgi:hypothetical protein
MQINIGLITLDGFSKIIKEVHFSSGLPVLGLHIYLKLKKN